MKKVKDEKSAGMTDDSALRIRMDMTFDIPAEMANQMELWGLNAFEECHYDEEHRQMKASVSTALYRKGA